MGAKAHSTVATTYTARPASSGRLRPHRSLIGPTTSCPSAIPARHAVSVSWTVAAGACRASVTSGSEGRYMSIASGGVAVRPPRISITSRPVRPAVRASGRWSDTTEGRWSNSTDGRCSAASGRRGSGTAAGPRAAASAASAACRVSGVGAPGSGMCPSLSEWSATYALSSYAVAMVR